MATYQISVTWDTKINNLYKDITLIQQGISAKLNISLRNISRVTVNYKVGNDYFTDLCEIDLENNKVIVPFKREVLQVGTQQLELVCHMKNGDVLPTPTYSYTVTRSLSNEGGIPGDEETLSVLQELIKSITENEAIVEAAEAERQANELHRLNNEDERINAEAERKANENTRIGNEDIRQWNEDSREQYEATRRSEEDKRLNNEAIRKNAETIRVAQENERLRKEIERQNNESIRQQFYNSFSSQLEHNEKLINDIVINIKTYGAKGDGVTDDSEAIMSAINFLHDNNIKGKIFFPSGEYLVTKNLEIWCDLFSLEGNNATIISNIPDGSYLLTFKIKNIVNNIFNSVSDVKLNTVNNIKFISSANKSLKHNCFNITDSKAIANITFNNVIIKGYDISINVFTNAYCIDFNHIDIWDTNKCFVMNKNGSNYGERITFNNSWFHSCKVAIEQHNGSGDIFISNSSFDYLRGKIVNGSDGRIFFNNCHFESVDFSEYWFECTNKLKVYINNSEILWAGNRDGQDVTTQTKEMFYTQDTASISLNSVYCHIGQYYLKYICGGNGRLFTNNLTFEDFATPKLINQSRNIINNGEFNGDFCSNIHSKSDNAIIENNSMKLKREQINTSCYAKIRIPVRSSRFFILKYKVRKQNHATSSFCEYNLLNYDGNLVRKYSESLFTQNSINYKDYTLQIDLTNECDVEFIEIHFNTGTYDSVGECIWVTDIEVNRFN